MYVINHGPDKKSSALGTIVMHFDYIYYNESDLLEVTLPINVINKDLLKAIVLHFSIMYITIGSNG